MVLLLSEDIPQGGPLRWGWITWPDSLVAPLEHYLSTIRTALARRRRTSPINASDHLWISAEGRPLSEKRIGNALKLRTAAAFGKAINPHLARDIAVTTLAIEDPLHVRAAGPVLGHATPSTTERHYQQATALQAQRALASVVAGVRARPARRGE